MGPIERILVNYETNIPAFAFIINFIVTVLLSSILSFLFRNYSLVLSNKEAFSKNLIIISTTTMLIITIVKSSLALSLGLVGALSIIRFRTAMRIIRFRTLTTRTITKKIAITLMTIITI